MIRRLLDLLPHDELRIEGERYMRRWWLLRSRWVQVRIHETLTGDRGRHLHSHPFSFLSVGLRGAYLELRPDSSRWYDAPWALFRRADDLHRLVLERNRHAVTLVVTGPTRRDAAGRADWGFLVDGELVPWWDYPIKAYDS